jgi:C-terminal processing protease CtpA/Prc
MQSKRFRMLLILVIASTSISVLLAQDEAIPPAEIENDEGGPVAITGSVAYTDPLFTLGASEPLIILEDQAGFVDRNRYFIMPPESQVMGQITSDFYTSPFTYNLALPVEPQGSLRDVDQDGQQDTGVMVYAVAYWNNTWGDPFLEERDLYGGGWSGAYASTRIDPDPSANAEVVGGTYVIYAPDDQQSFPSGFGEDGLLFTDDDPIVRVPQGYTIVNLDTNPFTFDRSREVVIDLIEGEGTAADDFSAMSYTEAFDAMLEKFRTEYAFTEFKGIDWDALAEEFHPRFEEAQTNNDNFAYRRALVDFLLRIPDRHVGPGRTIEDSEQFAGGLGLAILRLDDGRVLVTFVLDGSPADEAGIAVRASILELDRQPIDEAIDQARAWNAPYGNPVIEQLDRVRFSVRFPVGTVVAVTYQNPDDAEPTTVTLTAIEERDSLAFSRVAVYGDQNAPAFALPVEYDLLDSGYGYVKIYSFFDDARLSIQLWERMIQTLNANGVPGLIIDMRQNGGGNGFLADQMAAYFFDEPLALGNTGRYDESLGAFFFDPRGEQHFYPPSENLRYHGDVAVLIAPGCASACEFFSYDMSLEGRAAIVGQYPTEGAGGGIEQFFMPDGQTVQLTIGRAVDANGDIHIEGTGVKPTVQVPVTEETVFTDGDPILEAAIVHLDESTAVTIEDGGEISVGDSVTGQLAPSSRVQYTLEVSGGDTISIFLRDETGQFDTYLRLYDSDGNLLAENDDSEAGTTVNSSLEELAVPEDMTLIVEVATFEDSGEGEYTLEVVANE